MQNTVRRKGFIKQTKHFASCLQKVSGERLTHHVEEHDDAEVDADCRACSCHLRVVPDERPAEGGEGADRDHAVDHDAKHGCDHHQYLGDRRDTKTCCVREKLLSFY